MSSVCRSCGEKNLEGVDECAHCGADLRNLDLPKPASRIEDSVMHLPLTTLKMTPVHAVSPDTALDVAIQTLARQKTAIVEVVEDGKLLGVLSVRDVVTRVGADYSGKLNKSVREFMTPAPETLPPDAPVTFALNKMDIGAYRHVPVVQDGRIMGVVSATDVLEFIVSHEREHVATAGVTTSHGLDRSREKAAGAARA